MRAVSELFDATTLLVPCLNSGSNAGEIHLFGPNIAVVPLTSPWASGVLRKVLFSFWLIRNSFTIIRRFFAADAVCAVIPGDIGTVGMLLALIFRKPLFVRHCGNWFVQRTMAERFWKWFMECFAGGRNVMLATGGAVDPPSNRNSAISWIFATSVTKQELNECLRRPDREAPEGVRLIISCRQERDKGTNVVIESLPRILEHFPGASLDVVGDGASLEEFKALVQSLHLNACITFHGKVNHQTVLQLLQQANLFCYPTSASEGFPKAVLEALACGLPVITTRVSVLPQLIGTGCGILIQEATPDALAEAVIYCFSDRRRYEAMCKQAGETAGQYSLEHWRDTIGERLRSAWGTLRTSTNSL
jgi:glycosyltransferase involved in cell wall biosynthesis